MRPWESVPATPRGSGRGGRAAGHGRRRGVGAPVRHPAARSHQQHPGQDSVSFAGACATPRRIFATADAFLRQGQSPRRRRPGSRTGASATRALTTVAAPTRTRSHTRPTAEVGAIFRSHRSRRPSNPRWQARNWQNHPAASSSLAHHRNFLKGATSKALKARGFKFVGPTICYAFMQAVGMVDDHLVDCFRHGAGANDS